MGLGVVQGQLILGCGTAGICYPWWLLYQCGWEVEQEAQFSHFMQRCLSYVVE